MLLLSASFLRTVAVLCTNCAYLHVYVGSVRAREAVVDSVPLALKASLLSFGVTTAKRHGSEWESS